MSAVFVGSPAFGLPSRSAVVRVVLVALALALGGCGGCDSRGPLVIRKVLIDVEPGAQVDREAVRAVVNEALDRARGVDVEPDAAGGAVLRATVESFGRGPGGQSTLSLSLEVSGGEGPERSTWRGQSSAVGEGDTAVGGLVELAFKDALAQVLQTRAADELDSATLVTWLKDDATSEDQKRRAMRITGSRREPAAVEPLIAILRGDDRDLSHAALQALTLIGDPRAADAVIAFSDNQPSFVRKQCIDAIRVLGTPRGKAWLFTLSTGHADPDVQTYAARALEALEGPAQAQASNQPPTTLAEDQASAAPSPAPL